LTAENGAAFLHRCMRRRFNHFVQIVQTDGGSEFEAEFGLQVWLGLQVWRYCQRHRIARPYKKNEQAHPPKGHPRASIAPSAKNVWAGANTKQRTQGACCRVSKRSWNVITTTGLTWLSSQ